MLMPVNDTTIDERIKEDVFKRLAAYDYQVKDSDEYLINVAFEKAKAEILTECNLSEIPDGLQYVAADMVIGEFLSAKKTFFPNDLTGFNLNAAVKSIKVGDTDTVFALGEGTATPEQRLTAFIDALKGSGKGQFSAYRKLRW